MPFIWMLIAGSIAGTIAKLLQPRHPAGGLFIIAIGGSTIAGLMLYSQGLSIGFGGPFMGAIILLGVYAFTAKREVPGKERPDDSRKAA